jgi:putative sugar O-methyltransferase
MNYSLLLKPRKLFAAVRSRLDRRKTMNQAIKACEQRFGNDPNYRPDLVPAFFAPRPAVAQDDSAILKRIIASYKLAKVDQRCADEAFNVSNEWLPIYERKLGPVMKALLTENIGELQHMYQNFFRDPCSSGLAGVPFDMDAFFKGTIKDKYRKYVLCDALHRYDLWKMRTGNVYPANVLASPIVGNPYGYTVEDVFVRAGGDYQHYYAHTIGQLLKSSDQQVVVELGGGFGGLAYYLVRDNPGITFVDFDLPEALALATYYLMKTLPNLQISLYGEISFPEESLATPGIVMMPSFEIMKMPSKSATVSFNSYSLAEMSPSSIRTYIDQIARITGAYILHVNHNRNAVLSADKFGIEGHGFKLIRRELAGWTLGINPKSDEFEYLFSYPHMPHVTGFSDNASKHGKSTLPVLT